MKSAGFQENPAPSLELFAQVGAMPASAIIDIGGDASRLVDRLIKNGFRYLTVHDLSGAALDAAKVRPGDVPLGFTGLSPTLQSGSRRRLATSGMIVQRSTSSLTSATGPLTSVALCEV